MRTKQLLARIENYLGNGGLWNPEMMEHGKVRELILDIEKHLESLENLTTLHYQPPTTIADPKQKTIVMACLRSMEDADKLKQLTIQNNPEYKKGSWFFGGIRI